MLEAMPNQTQPTHIGGYRLLSELGAGGSGTVWAAEDGAGNRVALKLLHPLIAFDEASRLRLAKEARLVNLIRGGGVSRVLDYEADDSSPFIVTEFVDGPTVAEVVANGPMSAGQVAELGDDLREILERVHLAEVVHRDLKPSNVIMSAAGPQLIDFGIAQEDSEERFTRTGMITGTAGFVSPELLSSAGQAPFDVRIRGDWWAWSALLLNAVTGRPPYGGGHSAAITHRIFQGDPDVAGLPQSLQDQFRRALAVDPRDRISPGELVDALARAEREPGEEPDDEPGDLDQGVTTIQSAPPQPTLVQASPAPDHLAALYGPNAPVLEGTPSLQPVSSLETPYDWAHSAGPQYLPYVPPELPHFPLSVIALISWLGLLPARFGPAGLLAALLVLIIFGALGAGRDWTESRRRAAGVKRGNDVALSLALFPRHLLFGLGLALPGIVAGLTAGAIAWVALTGSLSVGFGSLSDWLSTSNLTQTNPGTIWGISVLVLLVSYFLPPSAAVRKGVRASINAAIPNRWVRGILAVILIGAAILLISLLQGSVGYL